MAGDDVVPLGDGEVDWPEILARLGELGYAATYTFEPHLERDRDGRRALDRGLPSPRPPNPPRACTARRAGRSLRGPAERGRDSAPRANSGRNDGAPAQSLEGGPPRTGGRRRRPPPVPGQLVAAGLTVSAAEALLAARPPMRPRSPQGRRFACAPTTTSPTSDPAFWPTHVDEWCSLSTMEGLVTFRRARSTPSTAWPRRFEPSKDGLSVHFTLKQGVEFHGGYGEITSEDVKYSYERIAGLTKPDTQRRLPG